jgi:hypothetical protein
LVLRVRRRGCDGKHAGRFDATAGHQRILHGTRALLPERRDPRGKF